MVLYIECKLAKRTQHTHLQDDRANASARSGRVADTVRQIDARGVATPTVEHCKRGREREGRMGQRGGGQMEGVRKKYMWVERH